MSEDDSRDEQLAQTVVVAGTQSAEAFGTPRVIQLATEEWAVEGFRRTYDRVKAAADRDDRSGMEMFIATSEALNWAASIDYYLQRRRRSHPLLLALRFARNRVHHQWAQALEPRDVPVEATFPVHESVSLMVSGYTVDWFWRVVAELPDPEEPEPTNEKMYRDLLAGRPAREALDKIEMYLKKRK